MYTGRYLSAERSGIIGKSRDYNDYCCLCHDQSPRNNVGGPEDRTRDLLNTSRTRIRPSYRARLQIFGPFTFSFDFLFETHFT